MFDNLGWLLIGAALGLFIALLVDYFWWRNRRVCTEDEIRLRGEVDTLSSNNLALQGQVDGFDTERQDWNTRFAALDTELTGYKGDIGRFQTENDDLKLKLGKFETDNTLLLGRIGDFEKGDSDLNARIGSLETEKQELELKLGKFEENNKVLMGNVSEFRSATTGLRDKLTQTEETNASLEARLNDLQTERATLEARIGELESSNASLNANIGDLESQNLALKSDIDGFKSGDADLQARIGQMESDNSSLRTQLASYEGDIDGLKAELVAARESAEKPGLGTMAAGMGAGAAGALGLAAMSDDDAPVIETPEPEVLEVVDVEITEPAADVMLANTGDSADIDETVTVTTPESDDLKKLWGIGPASERVLNANGIYTYADLCKRSPDELAVMLNDGNLNAALLSEETWPEQACLAADGKWDELSTKQAALKAASGDDLEVLFGIGPKSEQALYAAGIYKYSQLCKADVATLQKALQDAGINDALMNEETWAEQSCLAADGKWDELTIMQRSLKKVSGDDFSIFYGIGPKSVEVLLDNNIYTYAKLSKTDPAKLADMLSAANVNADLMNEETWPEQAALAASGDFDKLEAFQAEQKIATADDLTKLHGIGPKAQQVLYDNGIYKYSQLRSADSAALAALLADAGVNADLMNEETWPEQAGLLADGKTDALAAFQATKASTPEIEDDLQALWGVGPASEAVLHGNGIHSYSALANTDTAALKTMLSEADGSFALVREETWPQQARLLQDGDTDGLLTLQDSLSAEYVTRSVDPATYTGEKEDLTRIWGVGPAVQKMLRDKGIFTYKQLAGTQLTMLEKIIDAAGDRFNLTKPELWIPQADLLAAGDDAGFEAMRKKISADNK